MNNNFMLMQILKKKTESHIYEIQVLNNLAK